MVNSGKYENENIWDSAAPGWAKWEFALMRGAVAATDQMLDAANVKSGTSVLDLACVAGSQTIQAARRVGPTGRVLANDISSKMLTSVASNAAAAGVSNVETLHSPAEDLAEGGLRVDEATSRLGLMLFQSPQNALASVKSVLAENGRFAVLVMASAQDNLLFSKTMMIALKHAGKTPPPLGSPGLFSLSDPEKLEDLFQEAGYVDTNVEQVVVPATAASVEDMFTMMREAFGAYRALLADLDDDKREAAWGEIRDCIAEFSDQSGVSADMTLLLASGANPPT